MVVILLNTKINKNSTPKSYRSAATSPPPQQQVNMVGEQPDLGY